MFKTVSLYLLILAAALGGCTLQAQEGLPPAEQIRLALLAAPEQFRDSATVLGYNADRQLVTLREGSNAMICLADDPTKEGLSTACYHRDLEPFMARGRELRAAGKSFAEIRKIRGEEVKSGQLSMPDKSTLHIFTGTYDPESGEVSEGYTRFVVYLPYASSATTGLPESPSVDGGPWIMDPGTHRAHIMISPPR